MVNFKIVKLPEKKKHLDIYREEDSEISVEKEYLANYIVYIENNLFEFDIRKDNAENIIIDNEDDSIFLFLENLKFSRKERNEIVTKICSEIADQYFKENK